MARSGEEAAERVRKVFGDSVTAKPIHEETPDESSTGNDIVDLLTRLCYYYPQYTLEDAENLADSQVTALLLQAEKQRAIDYYNLTLISAAPHSKKGKMVEKLIKQYRKIVES